MAKKTTQSSDNTFDSITEELKQGVEELFTSEKYKQFLDVMHQFPNYSFNNCLLICRQMPNASRVCGYKKWQEFGRQVRKGEKAIHIFAPMVSKIAVKDIKDECLKAKYKDASPDDKVNIMRGFKRVSVFDYSQTEGEELPSICENPSGDVANYDEILERLIEFAPVPVRFDHINDVECKGYFSRETREIVLQEGMTELQNVSVLIHELAHSLLHADEKARNQAKNDKEIQAESVSYLVCKSLGLDTSCWSFGYVGGWAKSLELEELRAAEELIKATAAKIKDAIIRPEAKAA